MENDLPILIFINGSVITYEQFGDSHILVHHNKQSCLLSEITLSMLINVTKLNDELIVSGKALIPVKILVFEYGHANSSKKVYEEIESQISQGISVDQAGSTSLDTKRSLVLKLKEIHGKHWTSPHEAN